MISILISLITGALLAYPAALLARRWTDSYDEPCPSPIWFVAFTAVWSFLVGLQFGITGTWATYLVLGTLLITGGLIDLASMLLPNRITLGGTALALIASLYLPSPGWQNALLGAAVGAGSFFALHHGIRMITRQDGMGMGDVKLMAMVGAIVGLHGLMPAVFVAAVTFVIYSFALRVARKTELSSRVPFGPFLALGCMIFVLWGQHFAHWWQF